MESVSQNGILKQEEFTKFKERTVGLRFKQQVSYGVGAAMVFGLISAFAKALIPETLAGLTLAPALGLGAIAVVGVGLIYFSAKYLSESTLMEQDFQAKKIGMAARGQVRAQEQEPEKPITFPATNLTNKAEAKEQALTPKTTVTEPVLGDKVVSLGAEKSAAQPASNFVERVAANDSQPQQARA